MPPPWPHYLGPIRATKHFFGAIVGKCQTKKVQIRVVLSEVNIDLGPHLRFSGSGQPPPDIDSQRNQRCKYPDVERHNFSEQNTSPHEGQEELK